MQQFLEAQIADAFIAQHSKPAKRYTNYLPSQDMVLGFVLYHQREEDLLRNEIVKGEGKTFYHPEEVIIAYNEGKIDLHAYIKVKVMLEMNDGTFKKIN